MRKKSAESEPVVYSNNQQVKVSLLEEVPTEDEEGASKVGVGVAASNSTITVKESQVKEIAAKETNLAVLRYFDSELYDNIAVISPGVDQIQMMKEEQVAAIWLGSFDIVEEEVSAIWLRRCDLGEKEVERQKKRIRDKHKKRRRRNQIVKVGIG